jgi:GTPase SAR1 family protein
VDVPDQNAISRSNKGYLHNSSATIFVFDLSNRQTIEELDLWQEEMTYF